MGGKDNGPREKSGKGGEVSGILATQMERLNKGSTLEGQATMKGGKNAYNIR